MERFNRLMINEEEYVLLRAIIFSHFVTNGLTLNGQKIMLDEAEKYSKILMKLLQKRHGQLSGVKRYTELLQLIEICFRTGYNISLLFNYLTNVYEPGRFEKVVPEALIELLQLK
nr:unnamed protein product [Meloidogyne enterolobii]